MSGRIRVIDDGRERRLMVSGDTLSVYPLDGDWSRLRPEYWWRALALAPLPARPTALLVGLGGGTQAHLLHEQTHPRGITVIERDPAMVRVALDWFGLRALPRLEFYCAAAERVASMLVHARRRFDFVMEDAVYAAEPTRARPVTLSLAPLVGRRGVFVVNRHRRGDAGDVADALRASFADVRVHRVRREAENVLIVGRDPRR